MSSLKDQLLKAGLVDKKKAQQVSKQKHRQKQQGKKTDADEAKRLAQQAREEKAAKDRELNRQRQLEAEQKAIVAQIKQLIETNEVRCEDGDQAYNFTDGSKIKRIYLDDLLTGQLSRGQLAIVRLDESYKLVPAKVAERIAQRDASIVVVLHEKKDEVEDEDDPYADYKIPDDLMW
ncbi:DUF2058 domain-containing protein [Motiliproteus coralliicola]|uniref:DUF2058 domain-containing protein n=1 Tax=Motiliproteus coralliicola TaxID=2283196 RepID=A0A369WK73_9GAMM|nr:DUF2058 domain-containing protein [Motiliproteus coralliicola]RDE19855.1 DUF2058 domain-containing protein [Motiliproteus coralliicola]